MKIDLVYLWVDGADTVWQAKRRGYLPPEELCDTESFCTGRTSDNDELRYSLRSVERYAPWINHIYIITDGQHPVWLNLDNPKISMVDHRELFPVEVLPLYNSTAIEHGIHKIKGLSEHFLYANDDMMFARTLSPEFFFAQDGQPRCRFIEKECSAEDLESSPYNYFVNRASLRIAQDFGLKCRTYAPHHQVDAYTKSGIESCISRYREWSTETLHNRFRSREDMLRHIFSLYAVATSCAEAIIERKSSRLKRAIERVAILLGLREGDASKIIAIEKPHIELQLRLSRPALVCFNDSANATSIDRARLKRILERLYPHPSQFEKDV